VQVHEDAQLMARPGREARHRSWTGNQRGSGAACGRECSARWAALGDGLRHLSQHAWLTVRHASGRVGLDRPQCDGAHRPGAPARAWGSTL